MKGKKSYVVVCLCVRQQARDLNGCPRYPNKSPRIILHRNCFSQQG